MKPSQLLLIGLTVVIFSAIYITLKSDVATDRPPLWSPKPVGARALAKAKLPKPAHRELLLAPFAGTLASNTFNSNEPPKQDGSVITHDLFGNLLSKDTYKNGKRTGHVEYYPDGTVILMETFVNGGGDGSSILNNEKGNIISILFREDGLVTSESIYDDHGNAVQGTDFYWAQDDDKVFKYVSYGEGSGSLLVTRSNGDVIESFSGKNSTQRTWEENGNYFLESHYENGQLRESSKRDESKKLSGMFFQYYPNGQPMMEIAPGTTYVRFYYPDGRIKAKKDQVDGLVTWNHYYQNGSVSGQYSGSETDVWDFNHWQHYDSHGDPISLP